MEIGALLPIWSIIPFVGMLLSIALMPQIAPKIWDKYQLLFSLFWSVLFVVPFAIGFGLEATTYELIETLIMDYVPFIVLLVGLFAVAGNIHIGGTIAGTTKMNVIFLLIGTVLASLIGTTGAAMTLIRPLLRSNSWRKHKVHIVVFFIFLVANIGGCLTPLGDPPLFLGYIRGIPFTWTLEHIWPIFLLNTVLLLLVFALIDRHFVKKEGEEGRDSLQLQIEASKNDKLKIEGLHNIFFLIMILIGVILNGVLQKIPFFVQEDGKPIGINLYQDIHIGYNYFVQIIIILAALILSMVTTKKEIREKNNFNWAPMTEVAKLFLGIFITMIPALALLETHGAELGIDTQVKFFWITGALSAFLDNSPTFLVFLTTACSLPSDAASAVVTLVGNIDPGLLLAISAGAVFMGAITYIGNAPNFMVKSIAENNGIKMPSFFGYMAWSCAILIPTFIIDTLIFFI
ncbi:MAG: sodium:proton antiporter [Coriobacteriales bacterium]|nr:sodium:proton antiporter [Coriobacteriales bacterium]